MSDTKEKLSSISVAFHWSVALGMIALVAVGWYMEANEDYSLYPIHKSVGILMLLLVLPRVIWRLKNGWPAALTVQKKVEHFLGKLVHWVLLLSTIAFPISGMMMSGLGGHGLEVFGFELMAPNIDPETNRSTPINKAMAGNAHFVHGQLKFVIIGALLLHIAGALKHHLVYKDATLKRMLGKS